MKEAEDLKSSFIEYISDVLIRIRNVMIRQLFFIFEKDLNSCILSQSFKTVTRMARQTLNDESIHVTVFDLKNDSIQATFQSYSSSNFDDRYEYQVVEANIIQSV